MELVDGNVLSVSDSTLNLTNVFIGSLVKAAVISLTNTTVTGTFTFHNTLVDVESGSSSLSATFGNTLVVLPFPTDFIKEGDGTLSLVNITGSYTVVIDAGELLVTNEAIQSNTLLDINGGTLANADALTISSPIALGAATIEASGGDITINSQISAGGTLNKTGADRLILSGANTYTGGTTLDAGMLSLKSSGALGSTGTIAFGGGELQYSSANQTDYSSRFSKAAGQQYDVDTNGQNVTWASALTSTGGSLTKNGAGTLTLSGSNTYDGGTTIAGGVLMGDSNSLQGPIANSATLVFNQGADGNYAGNISGTGVFIKQGAGALTLSGTNTFTGGITLSAGSLVAGSATALPSGAVGRDYVINGGTLDLNNFDLTMSSLSGTGGAIALGTATLTVDQARTTSFAGAITGAGGFTKLGSGELTLSGTSNFSGSLSPNGGTLNITGSVTSSATSGIATSGGTATLNITGPGASWTSNADTLIGLGGGTGYLNISNGAKVSDTFSLVGRSNANDSGYVTVTGTGSTWTHSAGLVIGTGGVGSMQVQNGGSVSNTDGTIGGNDGSSGTVRVTGANSQWTSTAFLVVGSAGTGVLNVDGGGTVKVGATGAGVITLGNSDAGGGVLSIGGALGQAALDPGTIQAATVTGGSGSGVELVNFNHTGTNYTFAPNLTGNLSVQQNAGTTLLTGTNSYTGGTQINGGALDAENNSALGTGAVNVAGGILRIGAGYQLANAITLSGGTLQQGTTTGTQFSTLHNITSNLSGGTSTTARLVDGQSSGPANIQGIFSNLSLALNDHERVSDVFILSGVSVVDAGTGQTDTFVLQLQLDPSQLTADSFLAWLDPATNRWINAVAGNFGGTANFVSGAYNSSTDFVLGTYGIDTTNGTVWAVLDHNSSFAVETVPEPSPWLLLGLGLTALAYGSHRRRI